MYTMKSGPGVPVNDPGIYTLDVLEYVDETPRRPRRSEHRRRAEDSLGHHFVSVIGYDRPMPRDFGDNRGFWSVHVEVNADWRMAGVIFDTNQPLARAVRLEVVGCTSRRNAERLKAALDVAMHGREESGDGLRSKYVNMIGFGAFDAWWGEILFDCLGRLQAETPSFRLFSRAEHEVMVGARERDIMQRGGRI